MNKKIFGILAACLVSFLFIGSAYAFPGNMQGKHGMHAMDENLKNEIDSAIESGNYEEWASLHEENNLTGKLFEVINADNFNLLQQLHEAMQTIQSIKEQLGLPMKMGNSNPMHKPMQFNENPWTGNQMQKQFPGKGMKMNPKISEELRESLKDAVEEGNYQEWLNLHEENNLKGRILQQITEENFHLLKEMHDAREEGDFEKVKEIQEELGFKPMPNRIGVNRR